MTTYVKHETECDICGVKLTSNASTHIPGQAMVEPYHTSYHFKFDACGECEAELLKAKEVLIGVMSLKRQNAPAEERGEDVKMTRKEWEQVYAKVVVYSSPAYQSQQYGGGGDARGMLGSVNPPSKATALGQKRMQQEREIAKRTPLAMDPRKFGNGY